MRSQSIMLVCAQILAALSSPPVNAQTPISNDRPEVQAKATVEAYFHAWKKGADTSRFYRDSLVYFKSHMTVGQVMDIKRRFAQRWPIRNYIPKPGTMSARCSPNYCQVTGIVLWEVWSPERHAHAKGEGTFDLTLHRRSIIVVEDGAVISRHRPAPQQQVAMRPDHKEASPAGKPPTINQTDFPPPEFAPPPASAVADEPPAAVAGKPAAPAEPEAPVPSATEPHPPQATVSAVEGVIKQRVLDLSSEISGSASGAPPTQSPPPSPQDVASVQAPASSAPVTGLPKFIPTSATNLTELTAQCKQAGATEALKKSFRENSGLETTRILRIVVNPKYAQSLTRNDETVQMHFPCSATMMSSKGELSYFFEIKAIGDYVLVIGQFPPGQMLR